MKPIFLIGYMASGKTTLGKVLAKRLNRRFIDLDFFISQRFHTSVQEIFASRGEEGFRTLESNMLREVAELEDVVISCGGGTPCFNNNIDVLLQHGTVIFLDASLERILYRLSVSHTQRPLVKEKSPAELRQFIAGHLSSRLPFYRRAHITIPSDNLETRDQIARTLDNLLIHLP